MTNAIKYAMLFSMGAAVGAAVSWRCLKTKYERIAQKEIDDVKQYYREMHSANDTKENTEKVADAERSAYEEAANRYSNEQATEETKDDDKPYVISPEEFGENDSYDTTTLYYYSDGILATLDEDIIEDVEEYVVPDFDAHFGEYEDDSVFVRNPRRKCDYEILKDEQNYSDVIKKY